ncbi:hypothetical protein SAMN00017405_0844 [Desulfonispora thiosulfatigenes DSM 11270]|uniref:Uncharacterized protein n=1 Tax=Desulfonispora thiosulfatigenes DSM 11270 TaxID=656914 RepID=A0A1W1UGH0_DESTI|nr:hypothetical protein SAMN00017405_0844 [Desulfonispora thiosulfatigenes DSM 11270]
MAYITLKIFTFEFFRSKHCINYKFPQKKVSLLRLTLIITYTQPVGFGNPATLQAPLAGPVGNKS